jgi:DNA invertase Pin-like site-specific DNA recombinase
VLTVTRLDRLARSTRELLNTIETRTSEGRDRAKANGVKTGGGRFRHHSTGGISKCDQDAHFGIFSFDYASQIADILHANILTPFDRNNNQSIYECPGFTIGTLDPVAHVKPSSPDDALICRALGLKQTYIATQMGLRFGIFLSNHISLRKNCLQ